MYLIIFIVNVPTFQKRNTNRLSKQDLMLLSETSYNASCILRGGGQSPVLRISYSQTRLPKGLQPWNLSLHNV